MKEKRVAAKKLSGNKTARIKAVLRSVRNPKVRRWLARLLRQGEWVGFQ